MGMGVVKGKLRVEAGSALALVTAALAASASSRDLSASRRTWPAFGLRVRVRAKGWG